MDFLIDNFKHLTTTPENVEQLKKLVLQMAVQGKLTAKWREENPDVEPASVLFEMIKAEKEQLIKDKIVRKGKKQPPATIGNLDIPKSWLLVDLDDITQFITDGTHQTPRYVDKGKIFLSAQNIKPFKFMPEQHKYVSEVAYLEYIKNKKAEKGDILVGRVGSKGEAAVVDRELEFAIYVSLGLVKTFQNYTSPDYLVVVMNSPYGNSYATGNMSSLGASAGNFNLGRIRSFPIPFPSLAEQQAIVSKVEKLFTQIDQLHAIAQKRLNYREKSAKALFNKINHAENDTELQETWQTLTAHFHTLTQSKESVKQLRQSILQMAVQGKLTAKWREENPDVEPASVLLEKIKAEKKQLIKDGKIKRQKPLPSIADEEKPFELPVNWEWARIGNYTYNYGQKKPDKTFTYIDVTSIDKSFGIITEPKTLTPQQAPSRARKIVKNGTVIYSTVRPYLLNIAIIEQDYDEPIVSTAFAVLNLVNGSNHFLYYVLKSKFFIEFVESQMKGMAYPAISDSNFQKGIIPVPPLEEQKAIVSKVKQLMAWCDELENKIEKRDAYQEKMMQAVVKQAFKTEKETVEME